MQGTWDLSMVGGLGTHMPRGNEACGPQLLNLHSRAQKMKLLKPMCPRACALQQGKPLQREAHVLQLEKTYLQQPRPRAAKKNLSLN